MRIFLAISLIVVHLLNVIGYAIIARIEKKNESDMHQALNKDEFSGSEAITFRIPVALPYHMTSTNSYERVEGTFNHEGYVYRLVKQKYYNDTLYIVCVKDEKGTAIAEKLNELTASFAGKSMPEKSGTKYANLLIKDFNMPLSFRLETPGILCEPVYYSQKNPALASHYITSVDQPPQA